MPIRYLGHDEWELANGLRFLRIPLDRVHLNLGRWECAGCDHPIEAECGTITVARGTLVVGDIVCYKCLGIGRLLPSLSSRELIAHRTVEVDPDESWKGEPVICEETKCKTCRDTGQVLHTSPFRNFAKEGSPAEGTMTLSHPCPDCRNEWGGPKEETKNETWRDRPPLL